MPCSVESTGASNALLQIRKRTISGDLGQNSGFDGGQVVEPRLAEPGVRHGAAGQVETRVTLATALCVEFSPPCSLLRGPGEVAVMQRLGLPASLDKRKELTAISVSPYPP